MCGLKDLNEKKILKQIISPPGNLFTRKQAAMVSTSEEEPVAKYKVNEFDVIKSLKEIQKCCLRHLVAIK